MFGPKTLALQKRAQEIIPLGVNSNFRFWGHDITPYVEKAKGAYLWDVDGKKYIDYRMAFGPIILGHSYDDVDQKVIELSLIHISEPTRLLSISYAVFCL